MSAPNGGPDAPGETAPAEPDWQVLYRIPAEVLRLVRGAIRAHEPYLVLTGSKPDEAGCCPSDAVGAAESLVRAGILCVHRAPSAAGACPVAFYAFRGELRYDSPDRPRFTRNPAFREQVLARLLEYAPFI
jgi:hypothetical protein